jgi:hypothetical protein
MSAETIDNPESNSELALGWRESFEWTEPPQWQTATDLKVLAHDILADQKIYAALMLLKNREHVKEIYPWHDGLHTPPAAEHYRHTYLWDSGFFTMMYAQSAEFAAKAADFLESRLGNISEVEQVEIRAAIAELRQLAERFKRAGIEETFSVFKGQKANGFIPNVQYGQGTLWFEIEKHLSLDRAKKSSNYTQPPVLPLASLAQYKSMKEAGDPNANIYLQESYQYLAKFINYFHKYRSNSPDDPLVGVIEHHETGMDSSPQWDYNKPERYKRSGFDTHPETDEKNIYMDSALFVVRQLERRVKARGNLQKERELFWANDVGMNAIYFHNLQAMARLADELRKTDDAEFYKDLAGKVEQAMLEKMWVEDESKVPQKGFYSLKGEGCEPIDTITISNLFALVLPHMNEKQLEATLDMMDEHFDEPFPLPSVSKLSPEYDPHNQEENRLWRGPTWLNTNYYLVEFGLQMQARRTDVRPDLRLRCTKWANLVSQKSNELLDINRPERVEIANDKTKTLGAKVMSIFTKAEIPATKIITEAREHYNPITGEGQRGRVQNFGWTWLARYMTYMEPIHTEGILTEST